MITTGTNATGGTSLPLVRRFEAAGFRAWPAASVHYDGTWVVRLNAGHPAKRLNSVNPLDPGDVQNIEERVERAARWFEAYGRAPTFRLSPLSGRPISDYLDSQNWQTMSESLVMRANLDDLPVDNAILQIPLKDIGRFINAAMAVHAIDPALRPGLTEIISSIHAEAGLFVLEDQGTPLATAVCVHDGDLAGLFEIATGPRERGKGYGRRVVLSALRWARLRGAQQAWLQVEADNAPALRLYNAIGFSEVYRYHYRRPPGA
ncbi:MULTISPECIES: GNAT family N-acetyltransferase [Mesorhizobium]|uniref:GNAT family N-acetyltransferase n=1 Tax=Mesorhizobium denitrificans TaxID=2294114 RepID=A0A371XFE7_9HYPH|nr:MULTISPECIES: GNAT family N-acetyltransferase [Mesorhizobium]RFC67950.1 GNAT family N-acetyltransferase [Mesorhizobium denitrificans]